MRAGCHSTGFRARHGVAAALAAAAILGAGACAARGGTGAEAGREVRADSGGRGQGAGHGHAQGQGQGPGQGQGQGQGQGRGQGHGGMGMMGRGGGMMGAATPEQVALGDSIFHGKAAGGTCYTCHGPGATGTAMAPDLTDDSWLNGDGSPRFIVHTIMHGVAQPLRHPQPMPPMGGAKLTHDQARALAAYIAGRGRAASAARE